VKHKHSKKFKTLITKVILALLVVVLILIGYWYFSLSAPKLPQPALKDLAANHGISLGVHVSLDRLSSKPYTSLIKSQFSFITIDGEADWNYDHPTISSYNYSKVDALVSFAKTNNMAVQIHHLVWGEQLFLPKWLKQGNYSPQQLLDIMHSYISNVVGHLKGKVAVWTVANEVFTREQHLYNLQDWWANHIQDGVGYVDDAFIWARQADPSAKLVLNDFDNETINSVSNAELSYINAAKARGVPIDGIGMQMHINASNPPTTAEVVANMRRFGAIGVPVYVTEFDVNLNTINGSTSYKDQLEAQITYNMVRACVESKVCVSFDEFGLTDKESLLKILAHTNSHSYLFTSRFVAKPSFYSFRQALLQP
jgi:endo-1,4-beta-xylanase